MINELYITNALWKSILIELFNKYNINDKLTLENKKCNSKVNILPNNNLIFNAFNYFDLDNLKVVIIGQDPYINKEQAMGLSFSVPNNIKLPPSLKNIYKCIENTCYIKMDYNNGNLTKWAEQGVLLLNKTLTVFEKLSNSHKKIWKGFAEDLITYISNNTNQIIFVLWGNDAKSLKKYIDINKHYILEYTHPSPLSRNPFINCNHFTEINKILTNNNKEEIDWKI